MFNEAIKNVALDTAEAVQTVGATENFAAKLTEGAYTAVVGLGIVFLVLALIWGVLELFKVFFYTLPRKRAAESVAETVSAPAAAPAAAPAPAPAPAVTDDGALIAAITAAITAYRAAECNGSTYTGGFRVVSFKRK